jgi:hypothetical protein
MLRDQTRARHRTQHGKVRPDAIERPQIAAEEYRRRLAARGRQRVEHRRRSTRAKNDRRPVEAVADQTRDAGATRHIHPTRPLLCGQTRRNQVDVIQPEQLLRAGMVGSAVDAGNDQRVGG